MARISEIRDPRCFPYLVMPGAPAEGSVRQRRNDEVACTGGTIARTITSFFPRVTGPAKEAYEISRRLEQHGYLSTIFTTTAANSVALHPEEAWCVATRRFPVTLPFMGFDLSLPFAKAIMKESWDVVHCHGYRDFLALQSYFSTRIRTKPIVIQPHGSLFGYRHLFSRDQWRPYTTYDHFCREVVLGADRVVVSTNAEAREAAEFGVDTGRIAIIPPGVSPADGRRPGSHDQFRVLFVGRMSSARNVHNIIEAFSRVSAGNDGVLTIVGSEAKLGMREESGYLDRLKQQSAASRNGARIEFAGPLYGGDLEGMYSSSHVFVYASRYESFGLPIIEAAAHGLPVISTPVGVANELVVDGKTGYLVEVDNVSELADRIQELLDNRALAEEMGHQILELVKRKFDWERTIRDYVSMYDGLEV